MRKRRPGNHASSSVEAGFYQAMAVVPEGAGDAHFCGHRFFKRDMVFCEPLPRPREP